MRIVMFYDSLVSDWNHATAHFLRGVVTELMARGHDVAVYEPHDSTTRRQLERDHGRDAIQAFHEAYPLLSSSVYDIATLDLDDALHGADLVLVHESNTADVIARLGVHRAHGGREVLLFHDTHHRSMTDPARLAGTDLRHYDGVLAPGAAVTHMYVERGWSRQAWTWHQAADIRVFYPHRPLEVVGASEPGMRPDDAVDAVDAVDDDDFEPLRRGLPPYDGDVVWIGNFADDERTGELEAFLIEPVRRLGARAAVYGIGYPDNVIARLAAAGIEYRGWLPNYQVPEVFSHYKVTVHIPRWPYVVSLPGVPTIRPFEALACGIPLVAARWHDSGGLFTPGDDLLVAQNTAEMTAHLETLFSSPRLRARLAGHGFASLQAAHTCAHRVDELLGIYRGVCAMRDREGRRAPLLVPAS